MPKNLTQLQKIDIFYAICSDQQLYDKIIQDIVNKQIILGKYDYDKLSWDFNFDEAKDYFDSNERLKTYVNNQIYPKYKKQIDVILFEKQKKEDIQSLSQRKLLSQVIDIIQKYDIKDQSILKKLYSMYKSDKETELLQKIVDRIDDKTIKKDFQKSKLYHPDLFAKIARQIYNEYSMLYNIVSEIS